MKKFIMAVGVVALIAGTTSCKKDYTCDCSWDDATIGAGTISYTYEKVKKADATEACDASSASLSAVNGSCTLK